MASASRKACCTGCSLPSCASPSMVTMRLPATAPTSVRHDFVATPSTRTVHAAHCPSPQPNFVPFRSSSSRRTLRRVRSESTSIRRHPPFTSSSVTLAILPIMGQAGRRQRLPHGFLLHALERHLKGVFHLHHFAGNLHLIARNLALIIDAELVAVHIAHHRKRDVIPINLTLRNGSFAHRPHGDGSGE